MKERIKTMFLGLYVLLLAGPFIVPFYLEGCHRRHYIRVQNDAVIFGPDFDTHDAQVIVNWATQRIERLKHYETNSPY